LADDKKWAKELSANCGVDAKVLEFLHEELSESCSGDAANSKRVIEELTTSCHFNEAELKKFMENVSKNCPLDMKRLHEEIVRAEGRKDLAYEAINRVAEKPY
jgi:hypothetical protein